MKCRRAKEWDARHTAINQCMASIIIRPAKLPVSIETINSDIAPPVRMVPGHFAAHAVKYSQASGTRNYKTDGLILSIIH